MKKAMVLLTILALLPLAACTPYHTEGAVGGGAVGGVAGAFRQVTIATAPSGVPT